MERMHGMCEKFKELYPECDIQIANYFGYHERLQNVLLERIEQAINGTSTGMQDLEDYRAYAAIHGHAHHHHHHEHDHGHDHHHHHDHDHDHHHEEEPVK